MFLRVESNREVGHLLISIWNRQRSLQVGRVIGDEELCKSNRTAAVNLLIHKPRVPRTKGRVLHLNPEQMAEYRVEPNYIGLVAGDVMTFLGASRANAA